jgi:hypothetical protein
MVPKVGVPEFPQIAGFPPVLGKGCAQARAPLPWACECSDSAVLHLRCSRLGPWEPAAGHRLPAGGETRLVQQLGSRRLRLTDDQRRKLAYGPKRGGELRSGAGLYRLWSAKRGAPRWWVGRKHQVRTRLVGLGLEPRVEQAPPSPRARPGSGVRPGRAQDDWLHPWLLPRDSA